MLIEDCTGHLDNSGKQLPHHVLISIDEVKMTRRGHIKRLGLGFGRVYDAMRDGISFESIMKNGVERLQDTVVVYGVRDTRPNHCKRFNLSVGTVSRLYLKSDKPFEEVLKGAVVSRLCKEEVSLPKYQRVRGYVIGDKNLTLPEVWEYFRIDPKLGNSALKVKSGKLRRCLEYLGVDTYHIKNIQPF